ncbi:E3 ubiquitin-protein ligase TRIM33-like [Mercenaria mercenaria]|uniref:E3 ubiquitin-protein ligase TRIM33-like n=1 Tax=Mercenaria mercenaria TaxID=6596 RepID=UPI00234EFDF7|nr:E3 ubiquitin-protein ligase TRIM33-like [Mercenaria mercenaria]XP_045173442.2 E3 ubiquitin-protein ligase TRIM33-like [Mercenaria mercenaria]XP_045173443.2 E3 ubiquitin-protein ligase TRIM33-like [Mercenaria mercenaria]XP_045173444.2 E3 ubiquitin-protein ligase TRIM33-like [Mercenaria mercenaria]
MAEGVNLTSIKDGTDVDFGFVCTPCGEDHIREDAVKYCPSCQEYLCTTCTKHHGRQNATRSHKLLDRDDANTISVIAVTTMCHIHPEQGIEFFCNSHDMVYCAKCIAIEHRSCVRGVVSINKVIPSFMEDKKIQQKQEEMKAIQKCLTSIPIRNQEFIDSMQIQKSKIFSEIEEVEKSFIEQIAKLKKELTASLDEMHSNINEEYVSEISKVTPLIKELDETTTHLQVVLDKDNVNTTQKFVLLKLAEQTAKNAAKIYDDWECSGTKTLYFMENAFKTSMTTANLGQICQKKSN